MGTERLRKGLPLRGLVRKGRGMENKTREDNDDSCILGVGGNKRRRGEQEREKE